MGMRSGVQKVAGSVTGGTGDEAGEDRDAAGKKPRSKVWSLASNVLSGALLVVAAAVLLRRCGILHF
jgi:hypothetical protein